MVDNNILKKIEAVHLNNVVNGFKSYVTERKQAVQLMSCQSTPISHMGYLPKDLYSGLYYFNIQPVDNTCTVATGLQEDDLSLLKDRGLAKDAPYIGGGLAVILLYYDPAVIVSLTELSVGIITVENSPMLTESL